MTIKCRNFPLVQGGGDAANASNTLDDKSTIVVLIGSEEFAFKIQSRRSEQEFLFIQLVYCIL